MSSEINVIESYARGEILAKSTASAGEHAAIAKVSRGVPLESGSKWLRWGVVSISESIGYVKF